MDTKSLINAAYDGAVLTGLTVAYSMLSEKVFRMEVGDPGKPNFNKFIKLTGAVIAAVSTKQFLEKKDIIPAEASL